MLCKTTSAEEVFNQAIEQIRIAHQQETPEDFGVLTRELFTTLERSFPRQCSAAA